MSLRTIFQFSSVIFLPVSVQIFEPDSENKVKFLCPQLILGPFVRNVVHQTSLADSSPSENEYFSRRLVAQNCTDFYVFLLFQNLLILSHFHFSRLIGLVRRSLDQIQLHVVVFDRLSLVQTTLNQLRKPFITTVNAL
jgi:hypothetical protein